MELQTSSYSKGSKVGFASSFQGDRFCNRIVVDVFRTLQEEFPGIIGHISDRYVAKFEDLISLFQATDGIVRVTRERELGLERVMGKSKWANGPNLLPTSKRHGVSMPSDGGHRGHNILAKGGGTQANVLQVQIWQVRLEGSCSLRLLPRGRIMSLLSST